MSGPAGAASTLGGLPALAGQETRGASPRHPLWTRGSLQRPFAPGRRSPGAGIGEREAAGGRSNLPPRWQGGQDAAARRPGSSSSSCSSSCQGPVEVAAQSAPKRNCRPGPVLVLALALALAAAGSAPGPGLEWAAAAARGAGVGGKLLRRSQLLRCVPRSGLPRPRAGLGPALKGAAALPGPAAHSAAPGGGRTGR